jgi:hypothetical protein
LFSAREFTIVTPAMKTYVTYGFIWALAGALLTFALFFLGFHSAPEKLQTGQNIAMIVGLIICVICIVLGTRARRSDVPLSEPFGYGQALLAGVMITLFATLFGVLANMIYMQVVNPGMKDVIQQAQLAKFEEAGMSGEQIEAAERMAERLMHPAVQAVIYFVMGVIFGSVVALITSIFLRRPAVTEQPPATV